MDRRTLLKSVTATALVTGAGLRPGIALAEGEKLKVGFVYIAPIDVIGWTYQHEQGRQAVAKHFGDRVETVFVDKVTGGADAERVIQEMVQSGCGLVFSTATQLMNPTVKVAQRSPSVKFEQAVGHKLAENLAAYDSRFYEGRYILGQIAGRMTKTNTLGFIAAFPVPEVVQGINSMYLGAKSVNPDVQLKVVWINSFFDPPKEAEAATALLGQGVDVMSQITDSPAPVQVAEAKGVYSFGQSSDMKQYGPKFLLTSLIDNWAPYYIERVQAVLDGTWKSQSVWNGIKEGAVVLTDFSPEIPDDVQKLALETKDAIASGKLHPFTGPINRQDGSAWLAAGEVPTDEALQSMNFYVEGMQGVIPS